MSHLLSRCTPIALLAAGALLLGPGCDSGTGGGDGPDSEPLVDTDGDGLYDTFEEEISTDPELEDTDEDGYTDGEEWELYTNPLDPYDYEYLDGSGNVIWEHFPYPLDLEGEGSGYGDIAEYFAATGRWDQLVNLYSFYGNVVQIVATADT
jgi:hypothetical protein